MKKNNMIKSTKKKETMKKYEVCGIKKSEKITFTFMYISYDFMWF